MSTPSKVAIVAPTSDARVESASGQPRRLVEVRAYRLKPGTRAAFDAVVRERAVPLLRAAGMDVLAHGPVPTDDDGYFLVRAFDDLADLRAREDAFYGASAWREGPREAIVGRIEVYVDTLLWLSPAAIEDLRDANAVPG